MIKGNRRGFTLVEMLITIALVGILSPILFSIFVFGIQDYAGTDKFIDQQNRVNEAIRFIRQDYEECKKVTVGRNRDTGDIIWVKFEFPESYATFVAPATPAPAPKNKVWTFYKGTGTLSLYVGDAEPVTNFNDTSMVFNTMVDDLDISSSKFEYSSSSDTLKLYIKPNASNKKYKGRNINKEIITEFSVRNKYKDDVDVSPLPTVTPTPVP